MEGEERWREAKPLYKRAVELAPDDAKPLYYREYAEALTRHKEDAETRDVLEMVLRFDPQNLDLKIAMARSLDRLKMKGDALAMFQGALETAEKSADVPIAVPRTSAPPLLGSSARSSRRLTREETVLAEIQKRFPESRRTDDPLTAALSGLAGFYHGAGQYNLAVPLWERALKRAPEDASAAFGLAKSYDAVGAWVSALDFYKRAIELNRGNIEYRLTLADRYFDNEMNFQAINLWRDVLAVRPLLVETRLKLAHAYLKLEQYPDALREYERVLQIDPQNTDAKNRTLQLRGRLPGV
jgi:tetratricopeptide (TPR) repeat protein